jgi:hypothetical protein
MTRLLTVTCKRQLPGVFSHQLLKSFQRHNFPECCMNRFGAGFHPENFSGFVRQIGIQPYRCHCHSHCVPTQSNVYMPYAIRIYTSRRRTTVEQSETLAYACTPIRRQSTPESRPEVQFHPGSVNTARASSSLSSFFPRNIANRYVRPFTGTDNYPGNRYLRRKESCTEVTVGTEDVFQQLQPVGG